MSVFGSDLNLDQEVLACGKRGKITGVMFSAAGVGYRVAFPVVSRNAIGFVDEQMFSAAEVFPAPPETPAPNGMEYMLIILDSPTGSSWFTNKDDFIFKVYALLREKRPYHGYKWNATKGRYVLVQIANHPYPQP